MLEILADYYAASKSRKGQGGVFVVWMALFGLVILAVVAPILSEVFDVIGPLYTTPGMTFVLALIIPALALGVIWNIIVS